MVSVADASDGLPALSVATPSATDTTTSAVPVAKVVTIPLNVPLCGCSAMLKPLLRAPPVIVTSPGRNLSVAVSRTASPKSTVSTKVSLDPSCASASAVSTGNGPVMLTS